MLIDIYEKYKEIGTGSGDKGTDHCYIQQYYEKVFADLRHFEINFLEIGISKGQSIKLWREYFTKANIFGVDIKNNKVTCNNCTFIYGDATNAATFKDLPDLDIVIDDGSHRIQDQILSYYILQPKLKNNSIYIIEDIDNIDRDRERFLNLPGKVTIFDFRHILGRWDDVIVEIRNET